MLDQLDTLIAFSLIMLLFALLITSTVQAIALVSQRRGKILLWGVSQILRELKVPDAEVPGLAMSVMTHPSLTASALFTKYASAIRVDELATVLTGLIPVPAAGSAMQPWQASIVAAADAFEKLKAQAVPDFQTLLPVMKTQSTFIAEPLQAALVAAGATNTLTALQVQKALESAINAQASAAPSATFLLAVQSFAAQLKVQLAIVAPAINLPTGTQAIETFFQSQFAETLASVKQKATELKAWFDTVMDRTTDRFVAWTRYVSIGASFVLCFCLQVDALEIMKRLHEDKTLRAALVAQVDPALKQAKVVVDLADIPLASNVLTDADMAKEIKGAGYSDKIPADLVTKAKGDEWLTKVILDKKQAQNLVAKFDKKFDELAGKHFDTLAGTSKDLVKKLSDPEFQSILGIGDFDPCVWSKQVFGSSRRVGGILMASVLVGLGAPFWFNMLKNLSNLRPVMAGKVDTPTPGT